MATPDAVPEVGRLMPMAYTGSTFHLLDCPRLARAKGAHATYAGRAATNRLPCATCLPAGVRIVPEHNAA